MNRKGSEHVDWMLSMGIFLIAIITIFLLLKPGVQKEYKEVVLLDILEERFTDDFYWHVKRVPLFIDLCEGWVEGIEEVNPEINLNPLNFWRLGNTTLFYKEITDLGVIEISTVYEDEKDNIVCSLFSDDDTKLTSDTCSGYRCLINGNSNVRLDFVFYFIYYLVELEVQDDELEVQDFKINDESSGNCDTGCIYRIGAVEDLYGLNEEGTDFGFFEKKENHGEEKNYGIDMIKETWGFPESKDFFIKADNPGVLEFNYETSVLDDTTNVFTRTFRTNIVDKYGNKVPVIIYLGVW
ncbi:MAG: hypothetical protein AABW46_03035 [Nanoarchaeota archaeon]